MPSFGINNMLFVFRMQPLDLDFPELREKQKQTQRVGFTISIPCKICGLKANWGRLWM